MRMNNLSQVFNVMRSGGNPQALLSNIIQQNVSGNPVMQNVLGLMNSGNYGQIETIARNLCKEKGINPDEMIKNLQSQYGFK